jgi:hypothetical protein
MFPTQKKSVEDMELLIRTGESDWRTTPKEDGLANVEKTLVTSSTWPTMHFR